jgi:hypothetical protein
MFFSEEKNQKTFANWRALPEGGATAGEKFFASFFQKRSAFCCEAGPHRGGPRLTRLATMTRDAKACPIGA